MDHYKILGINKNASDKDIKSAYKKMAIKWHPDKNEKNKQEAEKKFKEISEAYQVLSNPEKRKLYDMYGSNYEQYSNKASNNFGQQFHHRQVNPEDLFREVFGNMGFPNFTNGHNQQTNFTTSQKSIPKKRDTVDIECTLEELYNGCDKIIGITISNNRKQVPIKIKPGSKHLDIFNVMSIDNADFVIKEKKHGIFIREENDLILEKTISLKDALTGFDASIFDLKKENKTINIGPMSKNNKHIIKGSGMPIKDKINEYGNLIIKFNITLSGIQYHTRQEIIKLLNE